MTPSNQASEGSLGWWHNSWQRGWIKGLLLIAATTIAYFPAMNGGFVWDDDAWTTGIVGLLRDASGLRLIWFDPSALQQYYPLSGTTFWLDYHLWKFWTTPYHVENVLLHVSAALLFWQLLLRLRVPGAWLASAIFALHPVMVPSAAWITERKNVLSLVFYLGALLAYERYAQWWATDPREVVTIPELSRGERRRFIFYSLAFTLFLCALLAKTTTFSLPAVILLIGWWKRGQIRWRADILPSLPFFVLSLGLCAVTAWLERNHVGAQGSDFALSFPQRCLVAGRVFWFYLGILFWPANLCFVYPRWQTNPAIWWQWLYPMAAVLVLLAFLLGRGRLGRGPAAALFFYVGTLFPLLGFMNAYGMRFSFVWNHWVYLPSLGIIALAAAGITKFSGFLESKKPSLGPGFCGILLLVLGALSWQESKMFTDVETLWRTNIVQNPGSFLVYNNLGTVLYDAGRLQEAIKCFQKTLQLEPNYALAQDNLGAALAQTGQLDEAIKHYQEALRLQPDFPEALDNFGDVLLQTGHRQEAMEYFRNALRIKLNFAKARNDLGNALLQTGKLQDSIQQFQEALRLQPNYADAQFGWGAALARSGHPQEAIIHFEQALQLKPNFPEARNGLGVALLQTGHANEGILQLRMALQLRPDFPSARGNLGDALIDFGCILSHEGQSTPAVAYLREGLQIHPANSEAFTCLGLVFLGQGQPGEAVTNFQKALQLQPDNLEAQNSLAWVWATCPDVSWRSGAKAVDLAQKANQNSGGQDPAILCTLAAAYAEAGGCPQALATARKALQLAESQPNAASMVKDLQAQIKCYEAGAPFRSHTLTNSSTSTQ